MQKKLVRFSKIQFAGLVPFMMSMLASTGVDATHGGGHLPCGLTTRHAYSCQRVCMRWYLDFIPEPSAKSLCANRKVTPTISVDDPLLMLGMPKGLTAATGMDALTHAIEAYVSTASTPVTDACALHAMKLVSSYLRTAVDHGDNIEARDMMR